MLHTAFVRWHHRATTSTHGVIRAPVCGAPDTYVVACISFEECSHTGLALMSMILPTNVHVTGAAPKGFLTEVMHYSFISWVLIVLHATRFVHQIHV